jgi:hypothetical protein
MHDSPPGFYRSEKDEFVEKKSPQETESIVDISDRIVHVIVLKDFFAGHYMIV